MAEKTFTDRPAYPVIFVVVISILFVGVLSALYRIKEPDIERQKREAYEKTILSLCADSLAMATGSDAMKIMNAYPKSYKEFVSPVKEGQFPRKAFSVSADQNPIAYVFDITGKGLWGTMHALVATSIDKETILGINIYEQEETPGLGARIGETWFRDQFRQKKVFLDGKPVSFTLIPEKQKPLDSSQINQITGASITSNAVISMLKDELQVIRQATAEAKP
jgi:Na+-transporting NADH:ubiquinone oxidoreductase subunit C